MALVLDRTPVRKAGGGKELSLYVLLPSILHTGVTVIRAFVDAERFNKEARKRFDTYSRINFYFMLSYQWLQIRVQFISSSILFCVGVLILSSGLGRNLSGLCLTFAMSLTQVMANLVYSQGWLDAGMNSMGDI
ncbi:hypothetical protein HDU67_000605 [Dinochytrium kinnereticum]|nr:hypothetical protein HDU67_000605 [Dinochytrium kinnereticum]